MDSESVLIILVGNNLYFNRLYMRQEKMYGR